MYDRQLDMIDDVQLLPVLMPAITTSGIRWRLGPGEWRRKR